MVEGALEIVLGDEAAVDHGLTEPGHRVVLRREAHERREADGRLVGLGSRVGGAEIGLVVGVGGIAGGARVVGRIDPHRLEDLLQPGLDLLRVRAAELDVLLRLGDYVEALVGDHICESASRANPGVIARRREPQITLRGHLVSAARPR